MENKRKDCFKTVSFRLNLSREDELEIYQTIQSIEANVVRKRLYDNKSKFIKMALKDYIESKNAKEEIERRCRQTEDYMEQVVAKARTEFVDSLKEHDIELVAAIMASVMKAAGNGTSVSVEATSNKAVDEYYLNMTGGALPDGGGELPDGAMDFLDRL